MIKVYYMSLYLKDEGSWLAEPFCNDDQCAIEHWGSLALVSISQAGKFSAYWNFVILLILHFLWLNVEIL